MAMTYAEAKESFMGIGVHYATYNAESGLTASNVGDLVTITGIGEAGWGSSGAIPIGILVKYEADGYITVQDAGYAEISIEDDEIPANEVQLGGPVQCNGAGLGAKAASYTGVVAVAVDATNHKAIVKIG